MHKLSITLKQVLKILIPLTFRPTPTVYPIDTSTFLSKFKKIAKSAIILQETYIFDWNLASSAILW